MSLLAPVTQRRRVWWLRWAPRLAVVSVIGILCFLYLLHRNTSRLREIEARLDRDDPGWRFDDIWAARERVPDAENSATVIAAALDLLPRTDLLADFCNNYARLAANERLHEDDYARLCNELNEWEAATAEARKLADMPRGRHPIALVRPNLYATALFNQQRSRWVARVLGYLAVRRAEEGDGDGALADCRAAINAGRSMGDEPFTISTLIRSACVATGYTTAERVLGQTQPSPAALTALQRLLEDEDAQDVYRVTMRGERAAMHEMAGAIEAGQLRLSQVAGTRPMRGEGLLSLVMQPEFKTEHITMLELTTRYLEAARLSPLEQIAAEAAIDADIKAMPQTAVLTRLFVSSIGNFGVSVRRKQAYVRSLTACLAAERYRQARGAWPSTLADLVPAELAAVPTDPFDGQPLRLRRLADGIVIYSVGLDQTDNGGNLAADALGKVNPGEDLGIRLWDPAKRAVPAVAGFGKRP